jgi:hypothetical protein
MIAPNTATRVYRRQFVIGPTPINTMPGWATVEIPRIGYLCHCPELRVASTKDRHGNTWYLLGLAIQTDLNKSDPIDELAIAAPDKVEEVYQSWVGRWIIIGDGKLYMDAAGLLGCFYSFQTTADGARNIWVSSSAGLLVEVLGIDPTPVRTIAHAVGIDWYPPPQSRYKPIRRLLPSQILDLVRGDLRARRLIPKPSEPLSYEALLDRAEHYLVTTFQQAAKQFNRLFLPLTAGYDSRLLLATAHGARAAVRTYTMDFKYIRDHDRAIPPKLAESVGLSHSFYYGGRFRKDLADLYDRHTGGLCVDQDRYFISHEYFNWCQKGDLILHGAVSEIVRSNYQKKRYRWPGVETAVPHPNVILKGFKARSNPIVMQAFQEWITWTRETHHEDLDWRDRLYWEQRVAGWFSAVLQSLDLIDAEVFSPYNSHTYFSTMLQMPLEKRLPSQHYTDLMQRMAPQVLTFPTNPPGPTYKRVLRKIGKATEYMQSRLHL